MKLCKCAKCGKKHFEMTNKSKRTTGEHMTKMGFVSCKCPKCSCVHVKKKAKVTKYPATEGEAKDAMGE